MKEYNLSIEGMHCAKCVERVTKALSGLKDAEGVSVNLAGKCAKVTADADEATVRKAVEDLGFEVREIA